MLLIRGTICCEITDQQSVTLLIRSATGWVSMVGDIKSMTVIWKLIQSTTLLASSTLVFVSKDQKLVVFSCCVKYSNKAMLCCD